MFPFKLPFAVYRMPRPKLFYFFLQSWTIGIKGDWTWDTLVDIVQETASDLNYWASSPFIFCAATSTKYPVD